MQEVVELRPTLPCTLSHLLSRETSVLVSWDRMVSQWYRLAMFSQSVVHIWSVSGTVWSRLVS